MARILVVEDEDEIRGMLAEVLADAGHHVIEAESGDAALVLLESHGPFDALVTDLHMPGQLNGLSLGRLFRAIYAENPILYVTGSPDGLASTPICRARETVMAKPYGLFELVSTVDAMLASDRT